MAKRNKLNSLEVQLASSILYYDATELENFLGLYDSATEDNNIILDGTFNDFISILRNMLKENNKSGILDNDNPQRRKESVINYIQLSIDHFPNSNDRENFQLWFEAVKGTSAPMELSEDIFYHLLWNEFKRNIDQVDNSDIDFKEKLTIRPKIPNKINKEDVINIGDLDFEEEESYRQNYPSGLKELDQIANFASSKMCVVAARPGVGKTLFMINMALACANAGYKSLFVSLEMNTLDIVDCLMNNFSGKNLEMSHTDSFGIVDKKRLSKTKTSIQKSQKFSNIIDNLQIFYSEAKNADSILDKIETKIKESHYEVIFIDYLQLLRYVRLNEWESLRNLTRDLKNLARANNVCIVTATQVSRESTEKGLSLTDLFGSSTIENDSDIIIGLESDRERRQGERAVINIKIMKNRRGDLGAFKYLVDYSCGRLTFKE